MNKSYWIVYGVLIILIVGALLIFPNMPDMGQMLLFALAIIITSVFTYSTRKKR